MSFNIKIEGLKKLEQNFKTMIGWSKLPFDKTIRDAIQQKADLLTNTPYPPKLPNQKYVRTFKLKTSWETFKIGDLQYRIRNTARGPGGQFYARWVVGDEDGQGQAAIHQGRWWLAKSVVENTKPTVLEIVRNELREFIKRTFR